VAGRDAPRLIELPWQPPLDWAFVTGFLARRLIPGVEALGPQGYQRAVRLHADGREHAGRVCVRPDPTRAVLRVSLDAALAPVAEPLRVRLRRLFDLDCQPAAVAAGLGPLARQAPGIRVPGAFDGFELAVRAVLGQQVSVAAAHTLAGRLAQRFGTPLAGSPGQEAPWLVFPGAAHLADCLPEQLAQCGLIRQRAAAIVALARAIRDDGLCLSPEAPLESTLDALRAIPGIGDWTAQYIAMRALAWADAFPAGDLVLMRALGANTPARARAAAGRWRPWRAYAVMHLWRGSAISPTD
jgi:AraC family transcriptional regulator of adaptative response / DNA-3-methyladenine glycosylase II